MNRRIVGPYGIFDQFQQIALALEGLEEATQLLGITELAMGRQPALSGNQADPRPAHSGPTGRRPPPARWFHPGPPAAAISAAGRS